MTDVTNLKPEDPSTTTGEEQNKAEATATEVPKPDTEEKAAAAADGDGDVKKDAAGSDVKPPTATSDSVFSMFGGGPKREKRQEADDEGEDEPSGSSKAKKDGEVA
ncbi:hypothetical protein ACJ72_07344, partial [Emergomyces africanus]